MSKNPGIFSPLQIIVWFACCIPPYTSLHCFNCWHGQFTHSIVHLCLVINYSCFKLISCVDSLHATFPEPVCDKGDYANEGSILMAAQRPEQAALQQFLFPLTLKFPVCLCRALLPGTEHTVHRCEVQSNLAAQRQLLIFWGKCLFDIMLRKCEWNPVCLTQLL